jgi:hypothetical protein
VELLGLLSLKAQAVEELVVREEAVGLVAATQRIMSAEQVVVARQMQRLLLMGTLEH